jgi:hypothetical protein
MSLNRKQAHKVAANLDRDREVLVGGDPALERHRKELFGTPADPDATPPDERYVPRGRVLMEWVGADVPYRDERILLAARQGLIPKDWADVLDRVMVKGNTRIDGRSTRSLRVEDGLSETVMWGPHPGTYVREVSAKDADTILGLPCGVEFRVLGYAGEQPANADLIDRFVPPPFRDRVRSIRVRTGEAEWLKKIREHPGGKRDGWWSP